MPHSLESQFRAVMNGKYMDRLGPSYVKGGPYLNKKLCLVATDQDFLIELLYEIVSHPKAYYAKYSAKPKDGMYLGRVFFVEADPLGEFWAKYKTHPKLMCNVQDDDFTDLYRHLEADS
jgi:hypothetical protein